MDFRCTIISLCFYSLFSNSCSVGNRNETSASCISDLANQNASSSEGTAFVSQLNDTITSWKNKVEIDGLFDYRKEDYFVSHKVLFNSNKTQGIGFLLLLRTSNEYYDQVKIVTGEKIQDKWQFYYIGNPTLLFAKCDNCEDELEAIAEEEIEERMLINVLSLGYLKSDCQIDESSFEKIWVTEDKRIDHRHKFLSETYPAYDRYYIKERNRE